MKGKAMKRCMMLKAVVVLLFLSFGLQAMQIPLDKIDENLIRDLNIKQSTYSEQTYNNILAGIEELKSKNLDDTNNFGRSRLHYAVMLNDVELVKMIIKHANPDILDKQDNDGKTALYYAAQLLRHLDNGFLILTVLLKAGANPNIQNYKANTPLLIGVKHALNDKDALHLVYIFLIDAQINKPDLNLENEQQETVLKVAKKNKFSETIKALEEAGAK